MLFYLRICGTINGQGSIYCSSEPRCRCFSFRKITYKADCSSLGLTRFPTFTENVSVIDMSHNNLTGISKDTLLPFGIKWLDISSSAIRRIDKGFIGKLSHLEYLDISENREFTLDALPNVTFDLQFTKIKVLQLNSLQCAAGDGITLKREHLYHLRNTSLVSLFIRSNRIEKVQRGVISNLPDTLENLTASDNRLWLTWSIVEIGSLKSLKFVDFSSQYKNLMKYLSYFRFDCNDSKPVMSDSYNYDVDMSYPEVRAVSNITYGTCMTEYMSKIFPLPSDKSMNVFVCFSSTIETILVSHSSVPSAKFLKQFYYDFQNLKAFYMDDNFRTILKGEVFSNKTSHLDYSHNFFSEIHPLFFKPANLTYLNLSNNFLGNLLRRDDSTNLLQGQTYLKSLDLAGNGILSLPYGFFGSFNNLELLDLSNNVLEDITFSFENLLQLQQLKLGKNRLKRFKSKTMNALDKISSINLMIDLRDNAIICSCHSMDFLGWILQHSRGSKISFKDLASYSCTFPNSTRGNFSELQNIISRLQKECASYIGIIIASIIIVTAILISICAGVVYRYRWRFRYLYYMAKRSYRGNARAQNENNRYVFPFDAFISYSTDDRMFILREFLPNIEEKHRFRLCLHERDFIPGLAIAENIANAIHDSRKVVCILSDSFLTSSWCMYEFNIALMEQIHRPDAENMLFLVRLKNFDAKKAPFSLIQFISDTTYATDDFPEDVGSQGTFWDHIAEAIARD